MRGRALFLAVAVAAAVAVGCQKEAPAPTSPVGEYQGTLTFFASAGAMETEAGLSLSENGTYTMYIAELGPLGAEKGTWTLEGSKLTLDPDPNAFEDSEVLTAMSQEKKPHHVEVANEFQEVQFVTMPLTGILRRAEPRD